MKRNYINSAGLLYFHLCGNILEGGMITLETADSYRYFEKGFYENSKVMYEKMQDEEVHVFGVIGVPEKVEVIEKTVRSGIEDNANRIINGKNIKKRETVLDVYGNTFYKVIQEFVYEDMRAFPCGSKISTDEWDLFFIYGGEPGDLYEPRVANALLNLWIEKEEPRLFGKQVIIRSFFMRDLVDRKVVACMPMVESGTWNILFEGGIRISLDSENTYSKDTAAFDELGFYSVSGISNLFIEPAYCYGKIFFPREICVEWHKVFLYLCAVKDIVWTERNFTPFYESFLQFLEENICDVEEVPSIIEKKTGIQVFIRKIDEIRDFLHGEDESVISKDFLLTMGSRYVYMQYLWELLEMEETSNREFSSAEIRRMIEKALDSDIINEKGVLWENVAEYMLTHVKGWKITGKRVRAGYQEVDLSVSNASKDEKLWKLGAYILVECKNWSRKIDLSVIRNIAYISSMKGNKTALLFAMNGITEDANREIERLAVNHIYVLCIEKEDLVALRNANDCTRLVVDKWEALISVVEDVMPI